jgi:uncharacterized surface protein with fasciclin (FAS1) repeats
MPDIVETAANEGNFNTLVKAVEAAKLVETLKSPGPYTVFAPTDDAFAQLPQGTLDSLMQDVTKLHRILTYHVCFGDIRSDDLQQINEARTVEGSVVAVEHTDGKIMVNDANVLKTDTLTDNGVIHVIDKILMPAMMQSQ